MNVPIRTVQQMYRAIRDGCEHIGKEGSHQLCFPCRLEILCELVRLHKLENFLIQNSGALKAAGFEKEVKSLDLENV